MRIGVSRNTHGAEAAQELVECAIAAGYDGVQFKTNQLVAWEFDVAPLRAIHNSALAMASAGVVFHPGQELWMWSGLTRDVLAFAIAAGSEHVCYAFRPTRERAYTLDDIAAHLMHTGEQFREQGIGFSFHNQSNSLIASLDQIGQLCGLLDPAVCGVTYDIGHAAAAGIEDLATPILDLSPFIQNVHIKDLDANNVVRPLGTGVLDLDSVLEALAKITYDGWLIVDQTTPSANCAEDCNEAMNFLQTR